MSDDQTSGRYVESSVRDGTHPVLPRRIWILGFVPERLDRAAAAFRSAGHQVRLSEPGGELATTIREFRPDLIVIDMAEQPERGRHAAVQLRADRATRQLPIVLVGVRPAERARAEKGVTGPTRRYARALDAPSVLNALIGDL